MQLSYEGFYFDNICFREFSFIFWSSLVKVYGKEFVFFLFDVFQVFFNSLQLEEEEMVFKLSEEEKGIVGIDDDIIVVGKKIKIKDFEDEESFMEEDDDDDEWDEIGVFFEVLEKEVVFEIFGDLFIYVCGFVEIVQYFEKLIEMVVFFVEYLYEGCCKCVIFILWCVYVCVWQFMEQEIGSSWEFGFFFKQVFI